jgi:Ca-activated chloride channel family protein
MGQYLSVFRRSLAGMLSFLTLVGCSSIDTNFGGSGNGQPSGMEIKFLTGSALQNFCTQAADRLNAQKPKLEDGTAFYLSCESKGSGDVVTAVASLAQQLSAGTIAADAPDFPTLISLDGEIYQGQLIAQVDQYFPGQHYIPDVTDTALLANSPMVFMTTADLAPGLAKQTEPFKAMMSAKTHQDLDSASPPQPIHYVHTAPTKSNSGLQTLVAQFAEVSGKSPEQMTVADVARYQQAVREIQKKITRYGTSTNSLAQDMVKNGLFWASIASVYESSVIAANSQLQPGQTRYEAVYPKSTFTSNMRAILATGPWISESEKAAANQVIEFLRSPEIQQIATDLGLRPGVPDVPLGTKFTAQFGVDPKATYNALRSPTPEVVDAMLKSWEEFAKKPSLVVLVVDSSGSMEGDKLPAVQSTLQAYVNSLGPQDQIALIDFDNNIRPPVKITGTPEGRNQALQFIAGLKADGGTRLYDAALEARNWLQQNLRPDAINAVLILTDGEDSGSTVSLEQLGAELQKSGFSSDQRIAFFTVGYGQAGEFNPDALKQIAELNGGYYREGNPATIATLMSDLQVEF